MFVLCDLDNCLALNTHRAYLAQADKWDAYTEACGADQCNEALRDILIGLSNLYPIRIVSGRTGDARGNTRDWLQRHQVPYKALEMRPKGDFRPNAALKEMFLMQLCENHRVAMASAVVRVVFEDDPVVVAMYRRWGLDVIQIEPEYVLHRYTPV